MTKENQENIVRYSLEELRALRANEPKIAWDQADQLAELQKDDPIADFDWDQANIVHTKPKRAVSIRFHEDLIAWYKREAAAKNVNYQSLMQNVLQSYRKNRGE